MRVHDIGLRLRRARDGALGFEVIVGGGMGRTPYDRARRSASSCRPTAC